MTAATHERRPASYDGILLVAVAALLSLGIVMVYSASIAADSATLRINSDLLLHKLAHVGLGVGLLLCAAFTRLEWLQFSSKILLGIGVVLLAVVLIPTIGVEVNGSKRWIELAGTRLQPSEFTKLAAIIYFADYFARKRDDLHLFTVGFVKIGLVAGLIGLLLVMEPDYGTTVVIAATLFGMMFLAGVRFWQFCAAAVGAGALMLALLFTEAYRIKRLISYLNPWADPFDGGFQLVQALIAIGRGELFGVGLGNSIQKLFYLPHANNDFLIALIGEELGAVGILVVLVLFVLLLWRALVIAQRAFQQGHHFAGFLAQGIGLLFALQAMVHIGVNIGILPTKGLNLPLMSNGGSSTLSGMAAMGLLFAVDRYTRSQPATQVEGRP